MSNFKEGDKVRTHLGEGTLVSKCIQIGTIVTWIVECDRRIIILNEKAFRNVPELDEEGI